MRKFVLLGNTGVYDMHDNGRLWCHHELFMPIRCLIVTHIFCVMYHTTTYDKEMLRYCKNEAVHVDCVEQCCRSG